MRLADANALFSLLSDPTRVRLLSLLGYEELTVAELTRITELSQSRVSTHLGRLKEAGLVRDRRAGASAFYTTVEAALPDVWARLSSALDDPLLESDRTRCDEVVASRDGGGWPDAIAGRMERHYSPGRTWESLARGFTGLIRLGDVVDIGAGDGTVASLLAPRATTYTCVDRSERMIDAARHRLGKARITVDVRVVRGDMHELPFDDASFDDALFLNALQHSQQPARALAEAARVLRPEGRLLAVTLAEHDHPSITASYGHLNAGFAPDDLAEALEAAGFRVERCEVTSRERRKPHFRVITAIAHRSLS